MALFGKLRVCRKKKRRKSTDRKENPKEGKMENQRRRYRNWKQKEEWVAKKLDKDWKNHSSRNSINFIQLEFIDYQQKLPVLVRKSNNKALICIDILSTRGKLWGAYEKFTVIFCTGNYNCRRLFHGAFQKLLERYNKCIASGGDYFEGD